MDHIINGCRGDNKTLCDDSYHRFSKERVDALRFKILDVFSESGFSAPVPLSRGSARKQFVPESPVYDFNQSLTEP